MGSLLLICELFKDIVRTKFSLATNNFKVITRSAL